MANTEQPIAIIGMACRVAGADSPSQLWDVLASSKDVQSRTKRFNAEGFYKPDGGKKKGLTNVDRGYFIQGDVDRFDNTFFSIPPMEAVAMDPQQRMLLEVTYEAVDNAGLPMEKFMGSNTAVYTGLTWSDYGTSLFRDVDMTPTYMSTGACNAIAANRISYFFDLHGPSLVMDTACSATMYALHHAVSALHKNEAEMAVVNGSNIILNPDILVCMSEMDFLSPTGRCRSFDASGDGYVRAEGIISILLKPLDKALADGDPIRAVIRGTHLNQDGRTQGLTLPSTEAQRANMHSLYTKNNIDPADIQYFEAHGTGTAAGDPLEMSAIDHIYRDSHTEQKLVVGSIKSNVGHLEAVAALAGLVKTVQALERGQIPPQMHFHNPNPKIDFTALQVPTTLMPWPATRDGVRRAAINSFGFGGSNGHAVLEYHPQTTAELPSYDRPFLFKVSAGADTSLTELIERYASYADEKKPAAIDFAHTLLARRSTHKKSAFVTASTTEELVKKLVAGEYAVKTKSGETLKNVAFIFTGQGAQWPSMGKQLIENSPLFRSVVEQCDEVLKSLPEGPAWTAMEELQKPKETSRLYESSLSQPLCTVLQLGLVELWKSWGVRPVAVAGHSSGEIGAAYASGALSLKDCVTIAYYRGLYLGSGFADNATGPKGSMCAVGLSEKDAKNFLKKYTGRLALAAVNSPSSCTISGDEDAILEVVEACKVDGTFCRQLRVDMAYHSHHMLRHAGKYENAMIEVGVKPRDLPDDERPARMFSSVHGKEIRTAACSPDYWKENMVSTVSFTAALTAMAKSIDLDAIVELGPHPALKGPVEDTLAGLSINGLPYFGSCSRGKPDFATMLDTVGAMTAAGFDINFQNVNAYEVVEGASVAHKNGKVLIDVPNYAWDHSRPFWAETRAAQNYRFRAYPRHDLLGSRKTTDNPLAMSWRSMISLKDAPWLAEWKSKDHAAVLPWSVYLLMAAEAARQTTSKPGQTLKIEKFKLHHDFLLSNFTSEETLIEFHFNLQQNLTHDGYTFSVQAGESKLDSEWVHLCSGTIFISESAIYNATNVAVTHDERALQYAQTFPIPEISGLSELHFTTDKTTGELEDAQSPLVLDSVLRLPTLMFLRAAVSNRYQLRSIDSIEVTLESITEKMTFTVEGKQPVNGIAFADTFVQTADGAVAISINNAEYVAEGPLKREPILESFFFERQILPDITYAEKLDDISLANLIRLVTHKWPMADIAIDLPEDAAAVDSIISNLQGVNSLERPRFRSLAIVGEVSTHETSDRIQAVKSLDSERKFHAIFTVQDKFETYKASLLPSGVLASLGSKPEDSDFQQISEATSSDGKTWAVGRVALSASEQNSPKIKIVAPAGVKPTGFGLGSQFLTLDSSNVNEVSKELSSEACDAIILDLGDKSMLTDLKGEHLLPWVQALLPEVKTLFWVSVESKEQPFAGVEGGFVRTLCTENPGLRAVSIVLQNKPTDEELNNVLSRIYNTVKGGDIEVELFVKQGVINSLRIVPDDELAASIGLTPALAARSVADLDYKISYEGGKGVELQVRPKPSAAVTSVDQLTVTVEATFIDLEDQLRIRGVVPYAKSELGSFFIGQTEKGDRVFGWSAGSHSSKVEVRTDNFISLNYEIDDLSHTLSSLANHTIAIALLDHEGRVRSGDSIQAVNVPGPLLDTLTLEATTRGARLIGDKEDGADINISFDASIGLSLNNRRVSLKSVFDKRSLSSLLVNSPSASLLQFSHPVHSFGVQDFAEAFNMAAQEPLSSVLRHTNGLGNVKDALMTAAPKSQVFRGDGAYVILGGLGGLGQYLSVWMVENGAKHIVTLSRKGSAASGAKELGAEIEALGGKLTVLAADASRVDQLEKALAEVRKDTKIIGCLNMAMQLQDRPFTTMTPEEWDQSLNSKIPTSWNLHNATINDTLDFFILFSSVASIIGNRMQSNYAVGNAFLNRLAAYRRSIGLTAVSLAVPAMHGIGVLANDHGLVEYFDKAGLSTAGPEGLKDFIKAAVNESLRPSGRSFIGMGLQMFKTIDGKIQSKPSQTQIFWADFAEFGSLMDHQMSDDSGASDGPLSERLKAASDEVSQKLLLQSFLQSLANILGYAVEAFDPTSSIAAYGLDSLNAVACRYWFFKEISIDVPVFDILGCKSILELVSRVLTKLRAGSDANQAIALPSPVRLDESALRPLSFSQQRLWFLHKFLADKSVYNLLLVCHIDGAVRPDLLEKAWQVLINRHEVLRTHFVDTTEGLQQVAIEDYKFNLQTIELADNSEFQAKIQEYTDLARSYHYNLDNGELVRCWLLRTPTQTRLFIGSHHLAWDRVSTSTVFDEVSTIYKNLLADEDAETTLEPVAFQFVDYAVWQRQCIDTEAFREPLVEYWTDQLSGIPDSVSLLPFAHKDQRPPVKQNLTSTWKLEFDTALGAAIKDFCAKNSITPFMFMTSSISALISRLTGDEDIVVGIADGDRGHSDFDSLIGFAVNMLPIRSKLQKDMPFIEHLENFRETCLNAYAHRELPFDYLLQKIGVQRNTSHNPIFQIMVNYVVHGSFKETDFGDFKFVGYDHYNARTQSDFSLDIEETLEGALECTFEFDTAVYNAAGISEFGQMYYNFIKHSIEGEGKTALYDIKLTSEKDESAISTILQPSWDVKEMEVAQQTLFDTLFDQSVNSFPNKKAVVDESRSLTFAEVNEQANAIANKLVKGGAKIGQVVGVYCESSVELAVAIYGIWKAGCAFVAIQDIPEERLRSIIEDVEMEHALVDATNDGARLQEMVSAGLRSQNVFRVDEVVSDSAAITDAPKLARALKASDPICCIFTSGSTGRPKGVPLTHGQVSMWRVGYYEKIVGTSSDETIMLASVPTFDISMAALYGAPVYGATLVVASREARYSPAKMTDLIVDNKVTNFMMTPSQLSSLLTAKNIHKFQAWTGLRNMCLAGEPVPDKLMRAFFALGLPTRVWNGYGPSEATILVSTKEITSDIRASSLTSPEFPAHFYILDERGNQVPFGVPGELFIGGPGVCSGYIKRPEQTAEVFTVDDSAVALATGLQSPVKYSTGDRFVVYRDGTLAVKGRIGGDRQVKIRGMRTELGEIETAIWTALEDILPTFENEVNIAKVVVVYRKEEELLASYISPGDGVSLDDESRQILTKSIKFSLRAILPAHMRPAAYAFLDEMPSTSSGKTDYKKVLALPAPARDSVEIRSSDETFELSEMQAEIADIWKGVLDLGIAIAPTDDFFSMGGHSLALINIQTEIEQRYEVTVNLADIFAEPSLKGMETLVLNELASSGSGAKKSEAEVDWSIETALPSELDKTITTKPVFPPQAVVMTGASSMMGIHMLYHLLTTTSMEFYCLAEQGDTKEAALAGISRSLQRHQLAKNLTEEFKARLHVFPGKLSDPTLGLSEEELVLIDSKTHAIYHFASDVSLFGNISKVRAGNIGVIKFLIGLAQGCKTQNTPNVKSLHFLSTWGVSHLQAWHDTEIVGTDSAANVVVNGSGSKGAHIRYSEQSMSHIVPGSSPRLAYLKVRWAAEQLLTQAAERGLPVSIFRGSMTAPANPVGLARDDINRRIIEGSLQTGLFPNFGGVMSWLTADFLADAMAHLTLQPITSEGTPQIWHLLPEEQDSISYANVGKMLKTAHNGQELKLVDPSEWFAALRASRNVEMIMQAAVLEEWWAAGWVPFAMDATKTLETLKEAGIKPRTVTRELLVENVVGEVGF
ncbi:Hybrid PKS-NRPS synthetase pynA [Cladobotryum mycophilum]|uniref:Hybrid PKS-NRPS synthetase pynA n=1 Tax=Cladobotryum mycophilum TaxID=491253 RepID=A0ABR0T4J5_9HYPO